MRLQDLSEQGREIWIERKVTVLGLLKLKVDSLRVIQRLGVSKAMSKLNGLLVRPLLVLSVRLSRSRLKLHNLLLRLLVVRRLKVNRTRPQLSSLLLHPLHVRAVRHRQNGLNFELVFPVKRF